jgi:hypothetical protein
MKTHAPQPSPPEPASDPSRGFWNAANLFGLGLAVLGLTGCSQNVRPVVFIDSAVFLEGDSVILSLKTRYREVSKSEVISVENYTDRGVGRYRRHGPGGATELLLELNSLYNLIPGFVQLRGDTLVYSLHDWMSGAAKTRLRDLSTGRETSIALASGSPYRFSAQGKYLFHGKRVLDLVTLAEVESLTPPPPAVLLLLDESRPEALILDEGDLKLWNPSSGEMRTLTTYNGGVVRLAQRDSVVLIQSRATLGQPAVYSYANVADLWRGEAAFRFLSVPLGYRLMDISVPEGSLLAVKTAGEAWQDSLYVFDFARKLKRKFMVGSTKGA